MVIDDSTNFVTGGIYREIVEDERLVFTWGATDGWPKIDPERLDESPLVTVTLSQISGKTEMTVHVELPVGGPHRRVEVVLVWQEVSEALPADEARQQKRAELEALAGALADDPIVRPPAPALEVRLPVE